MSSTKKTEVSKAKTTIKREPVENVYDRLSQEIATIFEHPDASTSLKSRLATLLSDIEDEAKAANWEMIQSARATHLAPALFRYLSMT